PADANMITRAQRQHGPATRPVVESSHQVGGAVVEALAVGGPIDLLRADVDRAARIATIHGEGSGVLLGHLGFRCGATRAHCRGPWRDSRGRGAFRPACDALPVIARLISLGYLFGSRSRPGRSHWLNCSLTFSANFPSPNLMTSPKGLR